MNEFAEQTMIDREKDDHSFAIRRLYSLKRNGRLTPQCERRMSAGFCRLLQNETDELSGQAIEAAERHADGTLDDRELERWHQLTMAVAMNDAQAREAATNCLTAAYWLRCAVAQVTESETEIGRWLRCGQFLAEQVAGTILCSAMDSDNYASLDAALIAIIDDAMKNPKSN